MPVHNGERFIGRAIDSVLAQTFTDFELLIIDDASADATAGTIRGYGDARVRYVANDSHQGLAASLNIGLRHANGAYLARLDHDDVSRSDRLAAQVAVLDARPETALVGSIARLIDEADRARGVVWRPLSNLAIRWHCLLENPFIHSATMFRTDCAVAAGGYRDDLPFAEDFDLWGRIMKTHDACNLDAPLIDYRQRSGSIMAAIERHPSTRTSVLRRSMAQVIRRHIEQVLQFAIGDEDADLLAGLTVGLAPDELDRFLTLFEALRARFERKWPDAARSDDYWRAIARALDAIAYRLTPPSRRRAIQIYLRALRHEPRLAAHLSWSRFAAAAVLGSPARRRARALTQVVR